MNCITRWKNTSLLCADKDNRKRGFTNLEVFTALVILMLVCLTVGMTFYFVFQKTRVVRLENQIFNNTHFAMQMCARDLMETIVTPKAGISPVIVEEGDKHDKLRFWGIKNTQPDELSGANGLYRLSFSTLNVLNFENAFGNAPLQVVYYLDEHTDADGGLILRRQTNTVPYPEEFTPKTSDPILCQDIQSIRMTYYDTNGNAFYDWDSDNPHTGFATPAMVEVSITAGRAVNPFTLKTIVKLPCHRGVSVFSRLP